MIAEAETKRVVLQTEQLIEARVPAQHRRLGVDTYTGNEEALRKTQVYLHSYRHALQKGIGIVFTGVQDTFKTFLACYALRILMFEDKSCFYLTHKELTEVLMGGKESFDRRIIRDTSFIVLDEIVPFDINSGEKKALTEFVQIRKTEGLPTFFATRLSMKRTDAMGISAAYGSDLYQTLLDRNVVIECSCDSRKKEKQRKERFEGLYVGTV